MPPSKAGPRNVFAVGDAVEVQILPRHLSLLGGSGTTWDMWRHGVVTSVEEGTVNTRGGGGGGAAEDRALQEGSVDSPAAEVFFCAVDFATDEYFAQRHKGYPMTMGRVPSVSMRPAVHDLCYCGRFHTEFDDDGEGEGDGDAVGVPSPCPFVCSGCDRGHRFCGARFESDERGEHHSWFFYCASPGCGCFHCRDGNSGDHDRQYSRIGQDAGKCCKCFDLPDDQRGPYLPS
jgi:hypothetical protein